MLWYPVFRPNFNWEMNFPKVFCVLGALTEMRRAAIILRRITMGTRGVAILAGIGLGLPAFSSSFFAVRVGLVSFGPTGSCVVSSDSAFAAYEGQADKPFAVLPAGGSCKVSAQGDRVLVGGKVCQTAYFSSSGSVLKLAVGAVSRRYRGWIHVSAENGRLLLVNEVSLETYLMGVVPCEMSASAPFEALKAQAIASRSYVIKKIDGWGSARYDVDDSVNCQVYRGAEYESENTNRAVRETANLLLTYQGKVADAVFGANAGGITEAEDAVWGGPPVPYLVPVSDLDASGKPYSADSKYFSWSVEFGPEQISKAMAGLGRPIGSVLDIRIAARTSTGRVSQLVVTGSEGSASVTSSELRKALGYDKLRSALFEVSKSGTGWRFYGKGWGHGVGLCQDGAVGRAKAGQTFEQILAAYYPGTQIALVRGDPLGLSSRGSVIDRRKFSR